MSIESATTPNTTGAQAPVVSVTLAELSAALPVLAALMASGALTDGNQEQGQLMLQRANLLPVLLGNVPLLAHRRAVTADFIWRMPAGEALDALTRLVAERPDPHKLQAMFQALQSFGAASDALSKVGSDG